MELENPSSGEAQTRSAPAQNKRGSSILWSGGKRVIKSDQLVAAHSDFFSLYADAPMTMYAEEEGGLYPLICDRQPAPRLGVEREGQWAWIDVLTRAIIEGAFYALVYDGQPAPRLTVDHEGQRVRIDVLTGAFMEGGMRESSLAVALRLVRLERDRLSEAWWDLHGFAESSKRVVALAEYMETVPLEQYDQTRTEHDDGSPACLLAHALFRFAPTQWNHRRQRRKPHFIKTEAARVLGLEDCAMGALYHGCPLGFDERSPTPTEAAAMLRHLAEEGIFVWSRVEGRIQA